MSECLIILCGMCAHYSGPTGKQCGRGPIPASGRPQMRPDQTCEFARPGARHAPTEVRLKGLDAIREWQDSFARSSESVKPPAQAAQPAVDPTGQASLF
jgi:hypothetical protein